MNPLTWQNPEQLFVAQVLKKIFYNSVAELRIPISASVSTDDNIVEIIFTVPLGEVKILVDGQVQEVCQVTAPGQTTSFSIEGWAPGVYKLEFKVAGGGYVYGELVIE
ncbi:DUF3244 domain-containing protein [Bacteroides thetaiotaomicron]|nr:DUF3244 domain-containing protein [Bacteroides thetaiotaomicron]